VADMVDKPKSHRPEMHVMSEDDIIKFLDKSKDGEYYPLFFSYLFTGMRRSELLAVRWSDVDLMEMTISVSRSMQYLNKVKEHVTFKEPKSNKSRRLVALTPANCSILREHKQKQVNLRIALELPKLSGDDLVFCHWDGEPYLPDSISHAWMKLANKTGLKGVRLHDSRHTMATLLFKQGVHPKVVQERLGHSSISLTLDTYSHLVPGLQQAAAVKLDDILKPKESNLEKEVNAIIQK
jgi:integrase